MTHRDGNAIVYCQGAFNTPNGKTAHGLVRFTERYRVLSVVDGRCAARDAGEVLDGVENGIPVLSTIDEAVRRSAREGITATHLVVGLAPDGGRLSPEARRDLMHGIELGLSVDCGLHDFLSDDPEMAALAERNGVVLRDVRRTPPRGELHFFSGKIEEVTALTIALLGTDSAIGKRTSAWILVRGLREAGYTAEMIGTGQTAWMQGVRYGILLDSLINDFVSGEIEHAVWSAWKETRADVIVIEGQGSLMNPAYPGGFEILAAGRPRAVILQHAPARKDYDGFPGYPIHPLPRQIQAIEVVSDRPVVAVTVNHDGIPADRIDATCREIERGTGLPAFDLLRGGVAGLVAVLEPRIRGRSSERP